MVYINPDPWDNAPAVIAESDAPTNLQATEEISEWARHNGFVRVPNFYLDVVRRGDVILYRAICYRPTQEDLTAKRERRERIDAFQARMAPIVLEEA